MAAVAAAVGALVTQSGAAGAAGPLGSVAAEGSAVARPVLVERSSELARGLVVLGAAGADAARQANAVLTEERRVAAERVARDAERVAAEQAAAQAAAAAAERERLGTWVAPLASYRRTAGFGATGGRWAGVHTGTDLAAPAGTPVAAVGAGTIVDAGWDGPYGLKVAVRHPDGTQTWYCHLSAVIQMSGTVEPGTVVGEVGSTGNSTGNHLHLEVRPGGGDPVNVARWLAARGVTL